MPYFLHHYPLSTTHYPLSSRHFLVHLGFNRLDLGPILAHLQLHVSEQANIEVSDEDQREEGDQVPSPVAVKQFEASDDQE